MVVRFWHNWKHRTACWVVGKYSNSPVHSNSIMSWKSCQSRVGIAHHKA